jgi:prepilin-type N-terminal cleavage/methylation domain-containing protein
MGNGVVNQRGFSLLELIVVLSILALAAGLAAPSISRSTDALKLRAEVAGFSAVLRHAREQAITTRQAHRVVVEPAAHQVRVYAGEEIRRTRPIPSRWSVDAPGDASLAVRFEPHPPAAITGSSPTGSSGA